MSTSIKRERFKKVASYRVQKIINFLPLLANRSNRNNYQYTDDDVAYMFDEIGKALKECKSAYSSEINKSNNSSFSFRD